MPGPHARFLERIGEIANIRQFVQERHYDHELRIAFDACVAMLSALRDKHIQMVSRYIVVKSREVKKDASSSIKDDKMPMKTNLAHRAKPTANGQNGEKTSKDLKGTGGSSLIPFLRQARDETGEPAINAWTRRILRKQGGHSGLDDTDTKGEKLQGLAGTWRIDGSSGGLCLY